MTGVVDLNETTVRQRVQGRLVSDFQSAAVDSGTMQFQIDFRREKGSSAIPLMRAHPNIPERIEPFPPALSARSVSGGKRHGFVQEEEFGVKARRHHGAPAPFEFQQARNPSPALELTDDYTLIIVQRPAPVAHQHSTGGRTDNRPTGIDAVL